MRAVEDGLARNVAAIAAASGVVGASFGTIAVASGLPVWLVSAMSLLVFAGGAQFAAVAVVASGGSPVTAVLAGLAVNARNLPFGLAVADVVGSRWPVRLVGSHFVVDESVAFALAQPDPGRRRHAYWICGAALFAAWNIGVLCGALAGRSIGDPASLGLDAAFPAGLVALLLPSLRGRAPGPAQPAQDGAHVQAARRTAATRRAAALGAVIALAASPFLPAGVPVLLALSAVAIGWRT